MGKEMFFFQKSIYLTTEGWWSWFDRVYSTTSRAGCQPYSPQRSPCNPWDRGGNTTDKRLRAILGTRRQKALSNINWRKHTLPRALFWHAAAGDCFRNRLPSEYFLYSGCLLNILSSKAPRCRLGKWQHLCYIRCCGYPVNFSIRGICKARLCNRKLLRP